MNCSRSLLSTITLATTIFGTALWPADQAGSRDAAGNTPLHLAALRNDADAVEKLLAAGAEAGATNDANATPLHYGTGSERIVAALLAHGAPADPVSSVGITPLMGAVARADSFVVARRLIAAGANVNARRPLGRGVLAGTNVLALAVFGGDARTIALLLERGADVNPKQSLAPLQAAAAVGDGETTRLLLEHGADINYFVPSAPGPFGSMPLNVALINHHDAVATELIERGSDVRMKTTGGYGTSPIILSAYNDSGDPAITRLLLARGVDVNTANDAGETALSYALKRGCDTPLVRFLRETGATEPAAATRAKSIPARAVPADASARMAVVRDSAQRAIDLLQRNSTAFLENGFVRNTAQCISCHQQSLPAVAFGLARERGLRVDEHEIGRQLEAHIAQRGMQAERAREMDQPTPGADVALGYDADGLNALRYAPDQMTNGMSHYLLGVQRRDGSWDGSVRRPPMEDGPVIATAWSVRAIQLYPPADRAGDVDDALHRARSWLAQHDPETPNERIFQLLGLAWANDTVDHMRPFAAGLIATQRPDGGWAQLPGLASDAWATGSALVALHKSGTPVADPAYQRGVEFLLRTQFDDGSWWVRSRTWPFQPHFDGKFPHGKDQWISAAGTAWATIALLLTSEPTIAPATLPTGQELIAAYVRSREAHEVATRTEAAPARATTINFAHDIQPLFERSCVNCHGGAKPKGRFELTSRAALLRGGQSGDPAIVPGYADDSPMIHQILGEVEDLEMPPLHRRDKYPALSTEEIDQLRAWIDAGAPWPESPNAAPGNTQQPASTRPTTPDDDPEV